MRGNFHCASMPKLSNYMPTKSAMKIKRVLSESNSQAPNKIPKTNNPYTRRAESAAKSPAKKDSNRQNDKVKENNPSTSLQAEPAAKSPAEKDSNQLNKKVEENRLRALIRLQCNQTPVLSPNIGTSWFEALKAEFKKEYFIRLSTFIAEERSKYIVYPRADEVFTWTTLCSINDIKVVIIGQDPYHGPLQAHGLSFSVPKGVPLPPSLANIYKELYEDIVEFFMPEHGDLSSWAKQGVLLLNACLTVRANSANSHKNNGWETFTDAVIKWFNGKCDGIVFLLWGAYAQRKGAFIDKKKHHVLACSHPSPLSAHKSFLGCKHFSKANEFLRKQGKYPISWNIFDEI